MSAVSSTGAALFVAAIGLLASASGEAAPLPTNIAAMKATIAPDAVQVRWGGRPGWGGGRVGWGYRGGYRRYGWGAATAGAIVGGAIARSAYYGGYGYADGYGDYGDEGYSYAASPYYGYGYQGCPPAVRHYASPYGGYYGW
jgi:hypothetical protein